MHANKTAWKICTTFKKRIPQDSKFSIILDKPGSKDDALKAAWRQFPLADKIEVLE